MRVSFRGTAPRDVLGLLKQCGLALSLGILALNIGAAAADGSCAVTGDPLVIVEQLQEGFAGRTGERTVVGADGCFTVDRVLGDVVRSPLRTGRLSQDQLLDLQAAIDAASFSTLPERAGDPSPVNPSILSVTLQSTTKILGAPAGATVADIRSRAQGPASRLATLAAEVLELTGS